MVDDGGNKEDKFDSFTSEGESLGYISLEQARVLAIRHARDNTDYYGDRYSGINLVWEVTTLPIAFHPVVTWLRRELDATREQACDEAVTDALLDVRSYARSLVSVAQDISMAPLPRAAYSIGISDGPSLEERIMRILNRKSPSVLTSAIAIASAGLLTAATVAVSSFAFTVAADGDGQAKAIRQGQAHAVVDVGPDGASAAYDDRGKRDPFLSPHGKKDVEPVGFDVESLELHGIVETANGFTAMLQGPNRETYFVKRGERFFNATLVAIDSASLTFSVQDRDLFGASSIRSVVVSLHTEEENSKQQ